MTGTVHKPGSARPQLTSRVCVPEDVLFQDLDGEAVLLNQGSGKYYGLDPTGTRMWTVLTDHDEIEGAYRVLLDIYDVAAERLQEDLLDFVRRLADHGLLEVDDG